MSTIPPSVPSAYQIDIALSAWHSARSWLLNDDTELQHDEAALAELLGSEDASVQDILARLLRAAVHAGSMADAAAERIEAMRGRQDRFKRRAEMLRGCAFAIMDAVGQSKVDLADLSASLRKGQPSVMIVDEAAVPDIYIETVVTRKIDKAVIMSVLKNGGEVPGTMLTNGLPGLTIRTR